MFDNPIKMVNKPILSILSHCAPHKPPHTTPYSAIPHPEAIQTTYLKLDRMQGITLALDDRQTADGWTDTNLL